MITGSKSQEVSYNILSTFNYKEGLKKRRSSMGRKVYRNGGRKRCGKRMR